MANNSTEQPVTTPAGGTNPSSAAGAREDADQSSSSPSVDLSSDLSRSVPSAEDDERTSGEVSPAAGGRDRLNGTATELPSPEKATDEEDTASSSQSSQPTPDDGLVQLAAKLGQKRLDVIVGIVGAEAAAKIGAAIALDETVAADASRSDSSASSKGTSVRGRQLSQEAIAALAVAFGENAASAIAQFAAAGEPTPSPQATEHPSGGGIPSAPGAAPSSTPTSAPNPAPVSVPTTRWGRFVRAVTGITFAPPPPRTIFIGDGGLKDLAEAEQRAWGRNETTLNSQAVRWLKYLAFALFGSLAVYYFLEILKFVKRLVNGGLIDIVASLKFLGITFDWHLYVFMGVLLLVIAAIPLSLAAALFRMIGEQKDGDERELRVPAVELGKVIAQLLEACIERFKK